MRYLVVSDNHGDRAIIEELLANTKIKSIISFIAAIQNLTQQMSMGNLSGCTKGIVISAQTFETKRVVDTGLDRVYMTHGHLSNVRFGLTQLALEAKRTTSNYRSFGHTHQLGCEFEQGILFLNPGSISQPRGMIQIPAYAIIESTKEALAVNTIIDHIKIDNMAFEYKR